MAHTDPRVVFEEYLRARNRVDVTALVALLHPDYVETYPQSGEEVHGAANIRAIMGNYPGGYEDRGTDRIVGIEDRWVVSASYTLIRIEGAGDTFTGVQRTRYPDGSDWHVITIGEVRDGLVWRVHTYFAQEFEPPAWRSGWVKEAATTK